MSYVNFNEKLLGLQGVEITDIKEFDRNLEIHIIQWTRPLLMGLLKDATTKSRYLNAMHTATETLKDSGTVFYIYFPSKNQPNSKLTSLRHVCTTFDRQKPSWQKQRRKCR